MSLIINENGEYQVQEDEITEDSVIDNTPYEEKVVNLIRQKYSVDDELAIQRQKDTKPQEFTDYFNFCEECKNIIKNKDILS